MKYLIVTKTVHKNQQGGGRGSRSAGKGLGGSWWGLGVVGA